MAMNERNLERIRKLEEQIAKKRAELVREKGRISEKERKARIKRLFQIGGLAEMAWLMKTDDGYLLGCLLSASSISPESERWISLKAKGDALLAKQDTAQRRSLKKEN